MKSRNRTLSIASFVALTAAMKNNAPRAHVAFVGTNFVALAAFQFALHYPGQGPHRIRNITAQSRPRLAPDPNPD